MLIVATGAVIQLALVGCGGDDDDAGATKTTAGATTTATGTTGETSGAACRRARKALTDALAETLDAKGARVGRVSVVQLEQPSPEVRAQFGGRPFVVAAAVTTQGRSLVATWVASLAMVRGGDGEIAPLDDQTRDLQGGGSPSSASPDLAKTLAASAEAAALRTCVA